MKLSPRGPDRLKNGSFIYDEHAHVLKIHQPDQQLHRHNQQQLLLQKERKLHCKSVSKSTDTLLHHITAKCAYFVSFLLAIFC